jgi:tetratricopeptide (TPR) repeat protein
MILALAGASYQRNRAWMNSLLLLEDNVKKSPGKARPHYNLGLQLSLIGRIDEAIGYFRAAIRLRPTSEEYNNLGNAYEAKGLIDQAAEQYRMAISLDTANAEAYHNLGRVHILSGADIDTAIILLSKAISLRPDYTDAYVNLSAAYLSKKKYHDAVRLLESVASKTVVRPDAHMNLGVAYYFLGNLSAANRELDILRRLDAQYAIQLERLMNRPYDVVR